MNRSRLAVVVLIEQSVCHVRLLDHNFRSRLSLVWSTDMPIHLGHRSKVKVTVEILKRKIFWLRVHVKKTKTKNTVE